MIKRFRGALVCATLMIPLQLQAQAEWTSGRPDGHAPAGVMGDHTHSHGEYMFSYRFMWMGMEGSRVGTDEVSDAAVVSPTGYGFMVTPTEMPMQMHMLGMMYAPSDRVTLMVMASYLSMSMDHMTRPGGMFGVESGGFGDPRVSGLVGLVNEGPTRLHLNAGVSIPTGSIEEVDVTPASNPNEVVLPYPMQVGSGTWDLEPGVTFLGMTDAVSYGIQAKGVFRLGENDRGYTLGNRLEGTGWLAAKAGDRFSVSARLRYQNWRDISGADASLDPMMVPTARPDLRGGKRLDIPLGVNFYVPDGPLAGFRVLAEYEIPVWQDLSGPQLETTGALTVAVQLSVEPEDHDD